jgi:hypothetical protein
LLSVTCSAYRFAAGEPGAAELATVSGVLAAHAGRKASLTSNCAETYAVWLGRFIELVPINSKSLTIKSRTPRQALPTRLSPVNCVSKVFLCPSSKGRCCLPRCACSSALPVAAVTDCSLAYFGSVITELQQQPLREAYLDRLNLKLRTAPNVPGRRLKKNVRR